MAYAIIYVRLYSRICSTEMYDNKEINLQTFEKIVIINLIETKGSYYHNTFQNYKTNMKKPWRIINETLCKRNQKNNLPMFIVHNNTLNRIANIFNDYFTNIRSDLASNICADGNNEMDKQYLLTQSQCTCKFEKIHEDILKIITKKDNKSSSGCDMFSNNH